MREKIRTMLRPLAAKLPPTQKEWVKLCFNMAVQPTDFKRHLNQLKYRQQTYHADTIGFVPPFFVVSISDQCNLRCPNCLYLLANPDKFFTGFIVPDKLREVFHTYNREKKAEVIWLTGGEPLMHPQFEEIVDIALTQRADVRSSSNGILVVKNIAAIKKLERFNVSMDSYDYATFEKYRGGTRKQFDTILDGFSVMRTESINHTASFILSRENMDEADRMIAFAESLHLPFIHFHNVNPHGASGYTPMTMSDEKTRAFLDRITSRDDYTLDIALPVIFDTASPIFKTKACYQPWQFFAINTKGDVAYCCHIEHAHEIGNAFEGYDFNSEKIVDFRKCMMEGRLAPDCRLCQRRFVGMEYAMFSSAQRKWIMPSAMWT